MVLKIFKAVWFLSLLALLTSFMFIYASVPEKIVLQEGQGALRIVSRETFFYGALALFAFCNMLVFIMSALYKARNEDFLTWFYGLIICLNTFFIIAINFLHLFNSGEKFNFGSIGFIIYGGVVLIFAWSLSWPVYLITRRKVSKPIV